MIYILNDNDLSFPDPALAEDDGLLAVGGDLSEQRLINAYQIGIFPWYAHDEPIYWYSPHERCVILPQNIHISKSMKRLMRKNDFRFSTDEAFERVIVHCRDTERRGDPGSWITNDMMNAYIGLHKKGIATSREVWVEDELVGGLYGVVVNNVFCGESMFSLIPDTSKAALIRLCTHEPFSLVDCQMPNPHLLSLGAEMINRSVYDRYLHGTPGDGR